MRSPAPASQQNQIDQPSQSPLPTKIERLLDQAGDEPVAILATLLTNRAVRNAFAESPDRIARYWDNNEAVSSFLLQLDPTNLGKQAEALISKRQRQVQKLMPNGWAFLATSATRHFVQYVDQADWPRGHRRHLLDAVGFYAYLQTQGVRGLPMYEYRWLRFQISTERFGIAFASGINLNGRARYAIQLFSRIRGKAPLQRYLYIRHWKELLNG